MLEHLDGHAKATLLAQAVAGMIMVFQRLRSAGAEITLVCSRESCSYSLKARSARK